MERVGEETLVVLRKTGHICAFSSVKKFDRSDPLLYVITFEDGGLMAFPKEDLIFLNSSTGYGIKR